VHTPLEITAQGGHVAPVRGDLPLQASVHSADRLWDALSTLLILAGTTLFLLARNGLASITDGRQLPPAGFSTWVQRADYFSAQSSLGLGMIGAGVAVGIWAAISHVMRRRGNRHPPAA
jgi:hypothetical protein